MSTESKKETKAEKEHAQIASFREQEAKLERKLKRVAKLSPAEGHSHDQIAERTQTALEGVRAKIKSFSKAS